MAETFQQPGPRTFGRRLLRVAAGLIAVLFSLLILLVTQSDGGTFHPYVSADIALVALLCAVPFALAAVAAILPRVSRSIALSGSIVLLGALPLAATGLSTGEFVAEDARWLLLAIRSGFALLLTTAACGFAWSLIPPRTERDAELKPAGLLLLLLTFVLATAVPETYVDSRCKDMAGTFADLADQSRVKDAQVVARRIAALNPAYEIERYRKKYKAGTMAADLEKVVEEIGKQAETLRGDETPQGRFRRAQLLGQIGRTGEAIEILEPLVEDAGDEYSAPAALLLGTFYENAEDWTAGRRWYRRGLEIAEARGTPSREMVVGIKGVAYAERKLGNYPEAEAMYLRLIEVAPSAEHHFLLAQYFSDAQKADLAYEHAARAKQLSPQHYKAQADKLIDELTTSHFGCFGVFQQKRDAESKRSNRLF